jgi:hypothetical protein
VARVVATLAFGLIVGLLGGFWLAQVGLADRPLERAVGAAHACAPAPGESPPAAPPASVFPPMAAARVATEAGDEGAAPESLLARTAEVTRDAPPATKATGSRSIRGRILDVDGRPVAGATVRTGRESDERDGHSNERLGGAAPPESLDRAVRRAVARFYSRQADLRETATDPEGRYQFDGLPDGLWWVAAWCERFELIARGRRADDEGDAQVRPDATLDFVATPVIELPIAVVMPDGTAAARAAVVVTATGVRRSPRTLIWSTARRTIGLVPGRWQLQAMLGDPDQGPSHPEYLASPSQSVEIATQSEPPLVTLALRPAPGIRGQVRCAGVVPGSDQVSVKLMRLAAGAAPDLVALARKGESGVRSQSDLRYFFKDLEPGRYLLGVSRRWQGRIVDHALVDVGQGVVEKDLELPPLDPANCLVLTAMDADGRVVDDLTFEREVAHDHSTSTGGYDGERQPDGSFRFPLDDLFDFEETSFDPVRDVVAGEWPEGTSVALFVVSDRLGRRRVDLKPMQRRAEVRFGVPAHLVVTVTGVRGSGCEGRVDVSLASRREQEGPRHRRFMGGGEELSADQTVSIGPVDPGEYDVVLEIRGRGRDEGVSKSDVKRAVTLVAGENRATVEMPALYSLLVETASGIDDREVQCDRQDSESESTWVGQATLDGDRHALFEDLVAGEYVVSSGGASLRVRVPVSGPIRLESRPLNALVVYIQDEEGRLAKAGFKSEDVVFRLDGAAFESSEALEKAIGARLSNRKIVFTIEREGRDLELVVDGAMLANPFDLGGRFDPAEH